MSTIATTTAALLGLMLVAAIFYFDRFFKFYERVRDSGSFTAGKKLFLGFEFLWFIVGLALILIVGIDMLKITVDTMEIVPAIGSSNAALAASASNLIDHVKGSYLLVLDAFGIYAFGWFATGCVNMLLSSPRKEGKRKKKGI